VLLGAGRAGGRRRCTEGQELEALGSEGAGVILDDSGDAWPADPAYLARRLGLQASQTDVIAYAIEKLGFVHLAPIRGALLLKFEPSVVRRLAAIAAFYAVTGRAAKRLILAYPGKVGGPDRYEIFNDPIAGLKRVEAALDGTRDSTGLLEQRFEGSPADRRLGQALLKQLPTRKPLAAISGLYGLAVKTRAENYSERLSRPLHSIASEDDWFGEVLGVWGSARVGWRLPSSESFDPLEVVNIARGRAHIVETRDSDPEGYRFRLWGKANPYRGEYKNQTLSQMPSGLMREDAMEDYWEVTATGMPTYYLIHRVEDDQLLSYARLLLPLAADGRRVDQLVVLINERPLPELDLPQPFRCDA
jgi:hypothetical protein